MLGTLPVTFHVTCWDIMSCILYMYQVSHSFCQVWDPYLCSNFRILIFALRYSITSSSFPLWGTTYASAFHHAMVSIEVLIQFLLLYIWFIHLLLFQLRWGYSPGALLYLVRKFPDEEFGLHALSFARQTYPLCFDRRAFISCLLLSRSLLDLYWFVGIYLSHRDVVPRGIAFLVNCWFPISVTHTFLMT